MKETSAVERADWGKKGFFIPLLYRLRYERVKKEKIQLVKWDEGVAGHEKERGDAQCCSVLTQNSTRKEEDSAWKVDQHRQKNL